MIPKTLLLILIYLLSGWGGVHASDPILLDLNGAIEIALEKSYQMKSLKLSVVKAREDLSAARGRFYTRADMDFELPNYSESLSSVQQGYGFSVYNTRGFYQYRGNFNIIQPLPTNGEFRLTSSGYQTTESYLTSVGVDTSIKRFQSLVRLQFTQPLFTVNSLRFGLKRAKLNYERTNKRFSRYELDIIYEVTAQFFNLYQTTREEEIARNQADQQREAYELAARKYDAGLIPEVEVLQMEVDLADSRNKFLEAQGARKKQADYFKQLIGLSLDENIVVQTDFRYQPVAIDSVRAIQEALSQRSEIREGEIELTLAKMAVDEVRSDGRIQGELRAFYDLSGISADYLVEADLHALFNSSVTDLKNRPRNKGVVFQLTVPLWDWGVNRAQVAAARVEVQQAEFELAEQKKTIEREVRSFLSQVRESENRLEVLKKSEELAEKSYFINKQRFENGDITSQELTLDQQRLTTARQTYLNAFISYKLAIADLTRKTMFDFEKGVRLGQ
jgi:outer membrane protein TolC